MEYIYLLIACTFFSLQFIFQKFMLRLSVSGWTSKIAIGAQREGGGKNKVLFLFIF